MDNFLSLFKNYFFRVVVTRGFNGPQNMAADEILLAGGREGEVVLRFYDWRPPTLSLGYFQRFGREALEECRQKGVPVVRRPTGGRAVFHEDEVTYSVTIPIRRGGNPSGLAPRVEPRGETSKSLGLRGRPCYAAISRFLLGGLIKLGVAGAEIQARAESYLGKEKKSKGPGRRASTPWCFESKNFSEITVGGKKLVGSAQRLYPYGLLQHGSIIKDLSLAPETQVFWQRGEDGGLSVTSLREVLGRKPGFIEVVETYTEVLRELAVSWEFSDLKKDEKDLIARLAQEKYERLDWPFESEVKGQELKGDIKVFSNP